MMCDDSDDQPETEILTTVMKAASEGVKTALRSFHLNVLQSGNAKVMTW